MNLEGLFVSGQHRQVLKKTVDHPQQKNISANDIPYVIGALALLGRTEEAEHCLRQRIQKKFPVSSTLRSKFYLSIGLVRKSQYQRAKDLLTENLLLLRTTKLRQADTFFVYQGLAFFHYYQSRLRLAKKWAKRAYETAFLNESSYQKALASDLLGHTLVQLGEISKGLEHLERAEKLAMQVGAVWLVSAIQNASIVYRSRFGYLGDKTERVLQKRLETLPDEDTYSKSMLLLELSQQYILRGKAHDARNSLEKCCLLVHRFENRRHEALLNLRFSTLHYFSGEFHQALNLIKNAKKVLNHKYDRSYLVKILGMEEKILRRLELFEEVEEVNCHIKELENSIGSDLVNRYRNRNENLNPNEISEDKIGNLKDSLKRNSKTSIDTAIQMNHCPFLYEALLLPFDKINILIDVSPQKLIILDKGSAFIYAGLTPTQRKIWALLANGVQTKRALTEQIWKYRYDPLRHDPLVESHVRAMKRYMGSYSFALDIGEKEIFLRSDLNIFVGLPNQQPSSKKPLLKPEITLSSELNYREVKVLEYLNQYEFIDTPTYSRMFKVTEMTALRDLRQLTQLGYVRKLGRARSTKYYLVDFPKRNYASSYKEETYGTLSSNFSRDDQC